MGWKETTLAAKWSKREKDVMFYYPGSKSDGHLLHCFFSYARTSFTEMQDPKSKSLLDELEARGYDITTLKFSIKKKKSTEAVSGT